MITTIYKHLNGFSSNPGNGGEKASISDFNEALIYFKGEYTAVFAAHELLCFKEGVFALEEDGSLYDAVSRYGDVTKIIHYNDTKQKETQPILNRANAGMSCFSSRSYVCGTIIKVPDPTRYTPGKGYSDFNVAVEFYLFTKNSDWEASRNAILQGMILLHRTNAGGTEVWHTGLTSWGQTPLLTVRSGTDESVSHFWGNEINMFAQQLVLEQIAYRSIIKGQWEDDPSDHTIQTHLSALESHVLA